MCDKFVRSAAACATALFTSFLKIAASFARGAPFDLSAAVTNSLGPYWAAWFAAGEKPAQGAAAPKTGMPGSAAVVEGHLIAVGVREREGAAERPVDGR